MKVGDFEITALLDGTVSHNLDELLKGAKLGENQAFNGNPWGNIGNEL